MLSIKKNKKQIKSVEQYPAWMWFYEEVKRVKKYLPKNWREEVIKVLGENWDSAIGGQLISDVYYLRTTDVNVLHAFKKVANVK